MSCKLKIKIMFLTVVVFTIKIRPLCRKCDLTKIMTGVHKIIAESNLVVVLFSMRMADDLVLVNITSSKAKKS